MAIQTLPSNSLINNYVQNTEETNQEQLPSSSTSTIKQLKSLDNKATNPSFEISDILKNRTNAIATSFNIANEGVAFSQITSSALAEQNDILSKIKEMLQLSKGTDTSDNGREAIRQDIKNQLDKLDDIASDTNFNQKFSLQTSNSDTGVSEIYSFQISEFPPITASSFAIQSNTEGLELTDLKNLDSGELTYSIANTQEGVVDTAIDKIEQFQANYNSLLSSLKNSVSKLNNQHYDLKVQENEQIKEYNYEETKEFDKSKLISEFGSFAKIQANTNQSAVIDLLSL